ncbi:MAG: 4Fe-4S binding protein [bacterium]|jgi:Fe-S-cluster-containing hydrogenase component 2
MKRKIIKIHADKCNGCGLCAEACHERAIEIVDGKAKLVSDIYCDGLGDCLPACPANAIEIIERDAAPYDDAAVKKRIATLENAPQTETLACGCPGSLERSLITKDAAEPAQRKSTEKAYCRHESQLQQWPVQLSLVNTQANYFNGANILLAADCTAYAYANFHQDFIKDHITLIGCPKLDDIRYYAEKLTAILSNNNIKSITVVKMEVPCCNGLVQAIKSAMLNAKVIVPYREVTISTEGQII